MELKFNLSTIDEAAREFIDNMDGHTVFAFRGAMGAGKTTFIAAVCRLLGATDDFGSPTFSIVNEYADKNGTPIYHFDFYRIVNPAEAIDMGAEDYFMSGNLCLIEWPEMIGNLLPDYACEVAIEENPDGSRTLKF